MKVGPLVAEVTTTDAHAATLVADYMEAYGAPEGGTNQKRLEWFVRHVVGHVKEAGDGLRVREAAETARNAALEERKAEKWT